MSAALCPAKPPGLIFELPGRALQLSYLRRSIDGGFKRSPDHTEDMSELPELLAEAVDDLPLLARVDLGGGDTVAVTPGATYVYRSDGLLSDETVETYDHDIDRLLVDTGRRKSTVGLVAADSDRSFKIPADVTDDVVEAVLEGILRTAGVLDEEESVEAVFRFSDLTLAVTDRRLLKHVGADVWDGDFETFDYDALTGLGFEEGSVATQVVVEANGRRERVKVPNEHAHRVRDTVQSTIFSFHGVSSMERLRELLAPEEDDEGADADGDGDGDVEAETGFVTAPSVSDDRGGASTARSEPQSTSTDDSDDTDADSLRRELAELNRRLDRQSELLETQQETLEKLVDELRRGR